VTQVWAWCRRRSTVAVASVLGMISSNPAGCRFDDTANAPTPLTVLNSTPHQVTVESFGVARGTGKLVFGGIKWECWCGQIVDEDEWCVVA